MLSILTTTPDQAPGLQMLPAAEPAKIIPMGDNADWHRVAPKARAEVLALIPHLEGIHAAGHGTRAAAVARVAAIVGQSVPTIRRKYDKWLAEGWQGLVNRAKSPNTSQLPEAFLQFWLGMVESFQRDRTRKKAWRSLQLRLAAWEKGDTAMAIPGYSTPPKRTLATGLPAAWSYKTLSRHKPSNYQLALRHQGTKAASNYLPSIRASRVGVLPGEIIFFDDEQVDVYVNFLGINQQATRPQAFHALDYASAHNICRGYQPTILDAGTGIKRGLTQATFEWFVIHLLTNFGYRKTGTTLVWEHGTASGSKAFEERLHFLTKGAVTIDRSGRFGDPAFKGMLYPGQRTGNFRYKAPLESSFSIHRTEFSALPGATGINRDHAPEENEGILRANKFYLKAMEALPFERQQLMALPVMPWGQFVTLANEIIGGLEDRTDHELTQWEDCGNLVSEFTLDGSSWWGQEKLAEMPTEARAAVSAFVQQPGFSRIRRRSRREAWQAGAGDLVRLAPRDCVALMGMESAIERTVSDRLEILFEDRTISADPMVYLASVKNEHGHRIQLKRGEKYLCFLNPQDPSRVQVCEGHGARRGAWIGEAPAFVTPSRKDVDALMMNYGRAVAATTPERMDVERRAAGEVHRRTSDAAWNARLLNSAPLTPTEHAAQAAKSGAAALAEMALAAAPAEALPAPAEFDPFSGE